MGLIERFFRRRSVNRPIVSPMSEGAMNAGVGKSTLKHADGRREELELDVRLITPDMPYEEVLRRLAALDQLNSEIPPVRIRR